MVEQQRVICKLCDQPLSLLEIGPGKFKIWVHRGAQLDKCKALRLDYSFMRVLFERMAKFKWKFGKQFEERGRLKRHGRD